MVREWSVRAALEPRSLNNCTNHDDASGFGPTHRRVCKNHPQFDTFEVEDKDDNVTALTWATDVRFDRLPRLQFRGKLMSTAWQFGPLHVLKCRYIDNVMGDDIFYVIRIMGVTFTL